MLNEEQIHEIFDETSWLVSVETIEKDKIHLHLANTSPAWLPIGADIDFNGSPENLVNELQKTYEDFDQDAYVESFMDSRGKNDVPKSIRRLCEDALYVEGMYESLYKDVRDYLRQKKEEEEMYSVTYQGCKFPNAFICTHLREFEEMLKKGYSVEYFKQMCVLSDVLGRYCSYDNYRSLEQILMRVYDDRDEVDRILENLADLPGQIELIQRLKDEIFDEEV